MRRSLALAAAVAVMGGLVLAGPAGASAPDAVTVPITLTYAATFVVTPGDPSPCDGVPITDTRRASARTSAGSRRPIRTA
jgi:hypothetical protein